MKLKVLQRECGGCTACCIVKEVEEIDKMPGEPCEYQNDFGCAIYKNRPPSCKTYACFWLTGILKDFQYRPDQCGVVVDFAPSISQQGKLGIAAYEVWQDALPEIIEKLTTDLLAVIYKARGHLDIVEIVVFPYGTLHPEGTKQEFIHGQMTADEEITLLQATGEIHE